MTNAMVHVELIAPDPDRLRAFYAALFGWDSPAGAPVAAAVSDQSSYLFLDPMPAAGPVAGGMGGGPGFTAHAVFYVGVGDVAAALARAEGSAMRAAASRSGTSTTRRATWSALQDPADGAPGPRSSVPSVF